MYSKYILTDYISLAISKAMYDKLEDGTFFGKIPGFQGVVSFGKTLKECEVNLHSTLEDWILVGLKLGHKLPVVKGINLNKKPRYEPVDTM